MVSRRLAFRSLSAAKSAFSSPHRVSRVKAAEYRQGASMPMLKRMTPIAVSLAIIFAVTVVLFYFKEHFSGAQHLIFFYLMPTTFVAIIYGSVLAMFCAIVATLVATFFFYAPIYSFYVSDPREVGELILFALMGLIGAKCIAELRRPPERIAEPDRLKELG
jgi:two-component system, OmpR family, sensor histidine kinase KdpD